jgi:hypothetical protein
MCTQVDVDLSLEGNAGKLSRMQCLLELDTECGFLLRNLGRQVVLVNNVEVSQGQKTRLPQLSLIEIGGIRLMFAFSVPALQRMTLQVPPCPRSLADVH